MTGPVVQAGPGHAWGRETLGADRVSVKIPRKRTPSTLDEEQRCERLLLPTFCQQTFARFHMHTPRNGPLSR